MTIFTKQSVIKCFLFGIIGFFLGCLTFSMAFLLFVRVTCFSEVGARCVMVSLLFLFCMTAFFVVLLVLQSGRKRFHFGHKCKVRATL